MSDHSQLDVDNLTFRQYQSSAGRTDQTPGDGYNDMNSLMVPLLGLAGEAGSLLTEFKKSLRQGSIYRPFSDQVSEEIGDILWYLSNIASKMDLDMEEIARENLAKVDDRWGGGSSDPQPRLFSTEYDGSYPASERLPKSYKAVFRMENVGGRSKLALEIDGKPCGDHLTDNSHSDDGYRFHDCFHLALATILGWSPILRKLLDCKRKSDPSIDEVEDGARASITEEAISVLVYEFAKKFSMFDGAVEIEYELLRTINMMTRPFEVNDKTPKEWESAILKAYAVWNMLVKNDGGEVVADATSQKFEYQPLK